MQMQRGGIVLISLHDTITLWRHNCNGRAALPMDAPRSANIFQTRTTEDVIAGVGSMDLNECLERFKPPNYLLCPVCLEVFTHPKLLPCSHTLCGRCVTGLLEHTPPGTVTRHGVEPNLHVACPVCRGNLAKTQVDSLPTNRALEEAVADWQRRTDRERLVWIKGNSSQHWLRLFAAFTVPSAARNNIWMGAAGTKAI